jgi:tetratricopeptide (TPR) repeat protein
MHKSALRLSLFVFAILAGALFSSSGSQAAQGSLSKSELLALVAGKIVPESIVADIQSRGLGFAPDEKYKSLLKAAGADDRVLAAVASARATSPTQPPPADDASVLEHLSAAGQEIRASQSDAAIKDLSAVVAIGSGTSAAGFVMGIILYDQHRYAEAGEIYSQILTDDPNFPQIHTRLSLIYDFTNDPENALREAKIAIAEDSRNPSAHLYIAKALEQLGKPDAAKLEIQEAIRCKPDYSNAYLEMGIVLDSLRDYDGAIAQYKQVINLDPQSANAHYDLGIAYHSKGDDVSAVREYREAKRLDPKRLDVRTNLGESLMQIDPGAAVTELRELAAMAPDWPLCHQCLGSALSRAGNFYEAEQEYQIAAKQNPGSTGPLDGLGSAFEARQKPDKALEEYRKAEKLDPTDSYAISGAGRVLLQKREYGAAIAEFQHAEEVDPSNWYNHDMHGEALEGSGDRKAAIAEYKQALNLGPKQVQPRLNLALALEKNGDWVGALENYHRAAVDEPASKANGSPELVYGAQDKYSKAKQRFQDHLADLRTKGKSAKADNLEARLKEREVAPSFDESFHAATEESKQAAMQQRFEEAETSAKKAVAIAEKIEPMDGRLPEALGLLGNIYSSRKQSKSADETFKRQLALSQKLYGPDSPMLTPALQNLAMLAFSQNDFASAEANFNRTLELNKKAYGENSNQVAVALSGLARVYFTQKDFAKTEAAMQRALRIFETMYGPDSYNLSLPIAGLCQVYDVSSQVEKSASCHARMISLVEKQFGPESAYLVQELATEGKLLRQLGRNDEAAKLEKRSQSIQSAQANPN